MTRKTVSRIGASSAPRKPGRNQSYAALLKAIESANRQMVGRAAAIVNQALVLRNWLIGACIVEYQQHGSDRARYGARLLETLSGDLATRGLKGLSVSMLERMRRLYIVYPQLAALIPSPVVTELKILPATGNSVTAGDGIRPGNGGVVGPLPAETVLQFSWTHLQEFMWLDDSLKRLPPRGRRADEFLRELVQGEYDG